VSERHLLALAFRKIASIRAGGMKTTKNRYRGVVGVERRSYLVPLSDVLLGARLEQALVMRNVVLAKDPAAARC
jgi:hypothetical protein